jgi:DHA1 family bicyclomycin/chloramphenicol resistance-like MFS transporter
MRIPPASFGFLLLLSGIAALPPIAVDMCLPALTVIGADLAAPAEQTGQTLSLFLAGYALSQLVFGPASDRFGRRPALLIGCVLFAVGAAGAASAGSIGGLLAWRVVQGIGAGAGSVMAIAVVRDVFEGAAARATLSYVSAVVNAAPLVGPTVGSLVLSVAGWRPLFAVQAAVGAVLLAAIAAGFAESLPRERVRALSVARLLHGYGAVLRHRRACGHALVGALSFGALFAYVAGSPFVFIPLLGPVLFGLSFAATALGTVLGALLSGRLAGRGVSPARLVPLGLAVTLLLHAGLLGLALTGRFTLAASLPPLILGMAAIGFVIPNAVHGALEPFAAMAGIASALRGFLQMAAGSAASAAVAWLYAGTPVAMAGVMAVCSTASLLVWLAMLRPARLLAPAAGS